MLAERMAYALCTVFLLWLIRQDRLERDGNEGLLAMYGFAGLFAGLAIFLVPLKVLWQWLPGKLVLLSIQLFTVWFLLFVAVIALYGWMHREDRGAKALLILGTSLRGTEPSTLLEGRLQAGLAYWQQYPEIPVIVTGGQVREEVIPEGEAMARWLRCRGIPESRIVSEQESRSTYQNFLYSLPLLRELGIAETEELAVSTDLFHFLRCVWLGRKLGCRKLRLVPSANGSLCCISWFFREVMVFVKLSIDGVATIYK